MAGYTNCTVGVIKGHSALIPIQEIAKSKPSLVKESNRYYIRMRLSTGQPTFIPEMTK